MELHLLTNHSWLQVHKDSPGDMLSRPGLTEEGVEGVIPFNSNGGVRWHLPIRLDPMLQAVELPASIAHLDAGLANMDRDDLTHFDAWILSFSTPK